MGRPTPLTPRHVALGATMVDFADYTMPLSYTSVRAEHTAVRENVGLFDLSHMGEFHIHGQGADALIRRITAAKVDGLAPGKAKYGVMCNEAGGIIDDIIVYRQGHDDWMIVVNASRIAIDLEWITSHASPPTLVEDFSSECALIAVQGPKARTLVASLIGDGLDIMAMPPFSHAKTELAGQSVTLSTTGYTGEDGVEIYLPNEAAAAVWDALAPLVEAAGGCPVGLAARDSLRLEASLRLYGSDMDESLDPVRAGLAWTVQWDADFIGHDAVIAVRDDPSHIRTIGLDMAPRDIPRTGYTVIDPHHVVVGNVTSGGYSFTLGRSIALALVASEWAKLGTELTVDVRGRPAPARVVALPFYRRGGKTAPPRPVPTTTGRASS